MEYMIMKYWPFAIVTTEAPATATSAFAFLRNSNHFRLISPPPLVWISKAAVGFAHLPSIRKEVQKEDMNF